VRLGQQGETIVALVIDAEGLPTMLTIHRSSGFALLDQAAVEAVRAWRFVPASIGGRPTPSLARIPVRFTLD
jgi:protein TonB